MMPRLSLPMPHRRARRLPPAAPRGFSLIELMVAVLMGLFLLVGVLGIVVSLSGTFRIQDKLTQTHDGQNFMLTVLDNTVHTGGYFVNPRTDTATTALPARASANPDGTIFAAGQYISGTAGSASDTLSVRYQTASGDTMLNCQGDTNTTGNLVWTNSFAVNANNQLTCRVSVNDGAAGAELVLADNVASVKFLYGVDTDGDGSADTYMDAAAVSAGSNLWSNVKSVRLAVTMLNLVNPTTAAPNLPYALSHTITLMSKS